METKISIVVPMYNDEKYLNDCVNSILNQTIGFQNLELIIVDDCSTDQSKKMAEDFAKQYSNIKVLQTEKNTGIAGHARNVGVQNATGKYLMFSDADDFYSLDACEILYNFMEKHDVDFVTANYSNATDAGIPWENPIFHLEQYDTFPISNDRFIDSFFVLNSSVCNKIFRRDFVKKNKLKFLEGVPAEDAFFSYSAMMHTNKIYYLKDVIYYYRMRNKAGTLSVSWNCSKDYFEKINSAYKEIHRLFEENHRMDYYRFFYAKSMTYMLYKFIDSNCLNEEEKIEVLSEMRWFYKLSKELNVPACQESLELIITKIINGDYKDAIDICKVIAEIRTFMPKEIKEKMSKPGSEMYEQLLKNE